MSEQIVKRRPMIDLDEFERRLRQPLAANQKDADPLAELARSFAGVEEDPYKTIFEPLNRQNEAAWDGSHVNDFESKPQSAHPPLIGGDFAAIEAGLLGAGRGADECGFGKDEETLYAQADEASWVNRQAVPDPDPAYEEVRSRRPLYIMAAMIIAGLVGIGASFGFKSTVNNPNEIATIRAADGPVKIHPDSSEGTEVADQDASVLGGAPQPPPVAVVNNMEQPTDLSTQANPGLAATVVAGLNDGGAASIPVPAPPAREEVQAPSSPDAIAALIEPKKVKTVMVRPDGTILPNNSVSPNSAATQAAHLPANVPAKVVATPKSTVRVVTTTKTAHAQNPTDKAPPARTLAPAKAQQMADAGTAAAAGAGVVATPSSFSVQLAAPGTEQEAREAQGKLIKKFGAELAGFHSSIRKVEVGGKPVYRVRFGDLASREEAVALCQKVQSSGGQCFVAKN